MNTIEITGEDCENIIMKEKDKITFIKCTASGAYFQFPDKIITITIGDDGLCMEYQTTPKEK